jgi:hypothetical protein
LRFVGKVHHNKLSSQESLGYFPLFYLLSLEFCCLSHLSQKALGNRCGLEFDKNATSTHPFNLFGVLTLELEGQLNKHPTPSMLILKFLEALGTAWDN